MKITDEMFAAARKAYLDGGGDLRAALEAALGAQRKPQSDLIRRLKESIEFYGVGLRTTRGDRIADAIACIEDLAAALKSVLPPEHFGENPSEITLSACATLERWGLK